MSSAGVLEEQDYGFATAIQERPVRLTYIILGVNFLIFVLMSLAGGSENSGTLLAFGAKSNQEIDQGQTWRFLTPVFIHIGYIHLLSNSWALWNVGPWVEKLYGGARFVALYLAAGIAGVVASYRFRPDGLSAGASGAIFGLFGVLLVFSLRHKNSIPPFYRKAVIRAVVPVILINLVIGQTIPFIDNSAHIGGLLAGGLLAAVIPFQRPGSLTATAYKVIQAMALVLVLGSFFQVYSHYNGPRLSGKLSLSLNPFGGSDSPVDDFLAALGNAQQAFGDSINAMASGDVSRVAKIRTKTAAAIDQLQDAPSIASSADPFVQDLLGVMQDQHALEQDVERDKAVTFSHEIRAKENQRRFKEIDRNFMDWVRTEGRSHGIRLKN